MRFTHTNSCFLRAKNSENSPLRQLTIAPIVTIEMDHPSEDWKDYDTWSLAKSKKRYLGRDIRFEGLGDAEDHRKCFQWEYVRTRLFKGEKFEDKNIDLVHPFYIETFPQKPYMSHAPKVRSKWTYVKGENGHNWEEDLLVPFLGSTEEVDLGFFKGKLPSYKADIHIHINPNWTKEHFLKLVDQQKDRIYEVLRSRVRDLEAKGYVFPEKKDNRPKSHWKAKLKALGHYRLLECVNLSERFVIDAYGGDAYKNEKVYRREISKLLPDLPCSWIVSRPV
jgi:hypothetical protein